MAARKKRLAPKQNKTSRWRVAVHEAGHAVAAHALGVPIDHVTIAAGVTHNGEDYAGRLELKHDPATLRQAMDDYCDGESDDEDREEKTFFLLLKSIKISFAGKLAEEIFFGAAEDSGVQHDLKAINTCAERLCPPDAKEIAERTMPLSLDMSMEEAVSEAIKLMPEMRKQEYEYLLEWIEHSTRKLLRQRRDVVETVALALLERETLTAPEVVKTILDYMRTRWRGRSKAAVPPVKAKNSKRRSEQKRHAGSPRPVRVVAE